MITDLRFIKCERLDWKKWCKSLLCLADLVQIGGAKRTPIGFQNSIALIMFKSQIDELKMEKRFITISPFSCKLCESCL